MPDASCLTMCPPASLFSVPLPSIQVVTHLCYSDFDDILPAIDRMDGENRAGGNIQYATH